MNCIGIVVISEQRSRMAGCFKDCIQRVAARKRRGSLTFRSREELVRVEGQQDTIGNLL